jgi:hypothetical protein
MTTTQDESTLSIRYQNVLHDYRKLTKREKVCLCQCHDPNQHGFFDCFVECCEFVSYTYITERGNVDLEKLEIIVKRYKKEVEEKIAKRKKESHELIYKIDEFLKSSFSKADLSDDEKHNRFLWKIEDSDNYFFFDYYESHFGTVDIDFIHSKAFLGTTYIVGRRLEGIKDFIQKMKIYIDSMRCPKCKIIVERSPAIVMDAIFFNCPKCQEGYIIYGRDETHELKLRH